MQTQSPNADASRAQALAQSLDHLTEHDVCALYGVTYATVESWRKHRHGPAFVRAGNRYLYPRSAVAADLERRTRSTNGVSAKAVL